MIIESLWFLSTVPYEYWRRHCTRGLTLEYDDAPLLVSDSGLLVMNARWVGASTVCGLYILQYCQYYVLLSVLLWNQGQRTLVMKRSEVKRGGEKGEAGRRELDP